MFYYGTSIVGPSFDFSEYKELMEKKEGYKNIPNTILPALKSFIFSLGFIACVIILIPKVPISYCATDEFDAENLFYKFAYFNIAITVSRFKFYSAWMLGQAAINAVGLSFNGYDSNGKSRWDRVVAAAPILELIGYPKVKIEVFIY